MKLTAIHIYPIKSMGGISLSEVEVGMRGLNHDRRYMLISPEGQFLTQRQTPELGWFQLAFNTDKTEFRVTFGGDNHDTLAIPLLLDPHEHLLRKATVWNDTVQVLTASVYINQWFSSKLQREVFLVYLPDASDRPIERAYQPNSTPHHVSLADGYPILIVSEASLALLNKKIKLENPKLEPLSMLRFRPNLVVSSIEPHQEDALNTFDMGSTTLHIAKPCSRCILTTIDPITLARGDEPLRTLSTYRKENNKILFGANALCLKPGKIDIHH